MRQILTFVIIGIGLLDFACVLPAHAQNIQKQPKFTQLKENNLLSNQNITAIRQDSKGFLWVGTWDGLNRFDGYEFKVYRNIENDSTSLIKNSVQVIYEDSRNTLWVSTLNTGLQYYDYTRDAFHRVAEFSRQHCQVLQIMEDKAGNIWIAGVMDEHAFVASLNPQTRVWTKYLLFPASEGIYSMVQISEDEFWLGSRLNGLFKWNKKTNTLTQHLHNPEDMTSLSGNYIQDLIVDNQSNLWIATRYSGLCKLNKDGSFKRFTSAPQKNTVSITKNDIMDLCLDGEYLWIAIENGGLSRLHIPTEKIENFFYKKNDPHSIVNNSIWSLYKDKQNRLWIGSFAKGLCVLDPYEKKFYNLELNLENNLVNAILKDSKGRMWIGSEDGLLMMKGTQSQHFKYDDTNGKSLSGNAVQSIFEDSRKQIWIGTWSGGINRYNEKSNNFTRYGPDPGNPQSLKDPNVFDISEDVKTKELLVCTFSGLHILKDQERGFFENIVDRPREGDQLLLTLLQDSDANLWVGRFSGLSQYNLKTKKIRKAYLNNDTTKVGDRVDCIFEDHKKQLWIGSFGGLNLMVGPDKFRTYTVQDGLPVNIVHGILEDSKHNLWLSTTQGLSRFNPETLEITTFTKEDGLNATSLRERAFYMDSDGYIYVGSQGVNYFHPDSIYSNPNTPPVYITDFKISNKSVYRNDATGILTKNISETEELTLHYDQNFFTIHYVGINFTASDKNKYSYIMEGVDHEWNDVNQLRFATYTNLDPGTYTFRVRASNNDGLWNDEGAKLVIHILPPWWLTWWFQAIMIFMVAVVLMTIYLVRTRNIRNLNLKLEQLVTQRTEELQIANQELLKHEEEINQQNIKLIEQSEELATQNEELIQSQEEVASQRDLVASQNQKLIESQKFIEVQNQNLEIEVAKRTKELVEYNQQLEQFAFISAHNLRSPVARILGLGNLLAKYESKSEDKEIIYPKLVQSARELDSVVKDLTTILEIRKNNNLFLSEITIVEIVNRLKESLYNEISQSGTTIITNLTTVTKLTTVKSYFESILYNLISNAIKYRHPDRTPVIQIESTKLNNEICIIVNDNGLGIDTSLFQDKLFTLYSRFHTHVEGKGMGLYLVRTQIIALGGRIDLESKVGEGTTFKVYFKA